MSETAAGRQQAGNRQATGRQQAGNVVRAGSQSRVTHEWRQQVGNFEKLSVLVIVVIIVMILVVAIYTWQENPAGPETAITNPNTDTSLDARTNKASNPWGPEDPDIDPQPDLPIDPPPAPPSVDVPPINIPVPQPEPGPDTPPANIDPGVDNEPWIHDVQSGEVLGVIAYKYLGSTKRMGEILALNPGMDPDHLRVGQKIKMPPRAVPGGGMVGPAPERGGTGPAVGPNPARGGPGSPVAGSTYTTRRGDRLDRIAKLAYGTVERWPEIFAVNKEKVGDPMRLDEGVQLRLPR
jgi:nucleoid-associated protein YgaU